MLAQEAQSNEDYSRGHTWRLTPRFMLSTLPLVHTTTMSLTVELWGQGPGFKC